MLTIGEDLTITCPQGDTGLFLVELTDGVGNPLLQPINGVAVFAVCKELKNGKYSTQSTKPVPIVDNTATINVTNAVSRAIEPGEYRWDIRIVIDPEYDEQGNVICQDDTDEVHSLFAGQPGGMPKYIVQGVAVDV